MGQQGTATGTGDLGAADLGMAYTLLEEVAINPAIELPELTQDGKTDSWRAQTEPCVHQDPGERSSDPTRLTQTCSGVSRSLQQRCGLAVACCRAGDTEYSSACVEPFEGDCHYHYLHHSLAPGK